MIIYQLQKLLGKIKKKGKIFKNYINKKNKKWPVSQFVISIFSMFICKFAWELFKKSESIVALSLVTFFKLISFVLLIDKWEISSFSKILINIILSKMLQVIHILQNI